MRPQLWRIFHHRAAVDVAFPLLLTVVFGFTTAIALTATPVRESAIELGILMSIVCFFVIAWLQHILFIRILFARSLVTYVTRMRERHPVTKAFGAEILKRFLSEGFTHDMVRDAKSLPSMLELLEEGERALDLVSYAMLLDKAAEMKPDVLLGIWHFDVVPLDEVFDIDGFVRPGYLHYFDRLAVIYSRIQDPTKKARLFVFRDKAQHQDVCGHKGWLTLCAKMQEWGMPGYRICYDSTFQSLRSACPGVTLDDIVYFGLNGLFAENGPFAEAWLIGMKKPALVGFRHAPTAVMDFKRLWESLSKSSSAHSLTKEP